MFENFNKLLSQGLFGQANDNLEEIDFPNLDSFNKNRYAIFKGMVLYELGSFLDSIKRLNYEFDQDFVQENKALFY